VSAPPVHDSPDGAVLQIKVLPRASADRLDGIRGDALIVRLTAPPVEGAANEALRRFLARALAVPTGAVQVIAGTRTRQKLVRVAGISASEAMTRLKI
jgi:uncharacterized protein (TIGR00251 family)